MFTADEINDLQEAVVDYLEETGDWTDSQIAHMDYVLGQQYLYEASSKTKIKIYLEYLNIGFNIEEIEDIVQLARSIRNPIVHRVNEDRLQNNSDIVIDIRKIVFYVLLRLLGVDEDMQQRVITPNIFGPDIDRG